MITTGSIALLAISFFFAGIVDAVCGGGGLLTIPTFMITGIPVHYIAGTNLCSTSAGSVANLLIFAKEKQIHYHSALTTLPFAILGAFLGARLNLMVPERYLEIIMVALVPIIAILVLAKKEFGSENRVDTLSSGRLILNSLIIGLAIGCYQGFYSVGAGAFYLLAFAILDRLDLIKALGNTKIIIVFGNLTAALTYALSGNVIWSIVLAATLLNIIGSIIGSYLALTKGARIIRPMFIAVLVAITLRLVYQFLPL